jgi:uncharacterized protein YdbL (DUF1318 family)
VEAEAEARRLGNKTPGETHEEVISQGRVSETQPGFMGAVAQGREIAEKRRKELERKEQADKDAQQKKSAQKEKSATSQR